MLSTSAAAMHPYTRASWCFTTRPYRLLALFLAITNPPPSRIDVAADRDVDGDLMQHDMGEGLPFKPGTFDGVIRLVSVCDSDLLLSAPWLAAARRSQFAVWCMFGRLAISSVSALQWICNADKKSHVPHKRLARFFTTLYSAMVGVPYRSPDHCVLVSTRDVYVHGDLRVRTDGLTRCTCPLALPWRCPVSWCPGGIPVLS